MTDPHAKPLPPNAPKILDERCQPLFALLHEGYNRLEVRVICVTYGTTPHLPKMSRAAAIEMTVLDGRIAIANMDFGHNRLPITNFCVGLNGTCLAFNVRPEWTQNEIKVFVDIPMTAPNDVSYALCAMNEFAAHAGEEHYVLQTVDAWLDSLKDRADHLTR